MLAEKIDRCLEHGITPIFCCGEALPIREAGTQNSFVETQLRESLFHLSAEQMANIVIAYEPIWAIGTGKTRLGSAGAGNACALALGIAVAIRGRRGRRDFDLIRWKCKGQLMHANCLPVRMWTADWWAAHHWWRKILSRSYARFNNVLRFSHLVIAAYN